MAILVRVCTPRGSCRFALALQDDSVFADFNVDDSGLVYLHAISFDGYGYCGNRDESIINFGRMTADESRALLDAVARDAVETEEIESILLGYFKAHSDEIWEDALASHGLLL